MSSGAAQAGRTNAGHGRTLRRVAPDRFGVFDLENSAGTPIYVHAKICIIDDTWFTCGSDNFNRRSWTTDSELTCAVFDTTAGRREPDSADTSTGSARPLAHGLRLQLWAEHLGLDQDDPSSTPRRLRSGSGTAPPMLWTSGTKPAAARRAPRDRCDTTLRNAYRPFSVSGRRLQTGL